MGLIEIVTRPDIRSGKEAAMVFRKIQIILKELGISEGSLEEVLWSILADFIFDVFLCRDL